MKWKVKITWRKASNIACAICIPTAVVFAYYGIEGWGWFLFVGFATAPTE